MPEISVRMWSPIWLQNPTRNDHEVQQMERELHRPLKDLLVH